VDTQHWRGVAHAAAELSELQNRASSFQSWCHSEVLRQVLTDVANELRDKGVLDEEESFIDATFAMALSVSVPLVALTAKLLLISCKHRLDGRGPSLQAQPVEAALELLKSLNHRRRQRSVSVANAVPCFTAFDSICFVMASISSLWVCDSQPQA
jgi:hypothetical protein